MTDIKISDVLFLMKERYSSDITEIMNREPLLLQKISRATDVEWDGVGKYFKRPVHLEGGMSQGFYAEAEALPPSEPQVGDSFLIYCKAMAFTIRITRQNLLSLKQGMGGFVNSKSFEVNQNTMSLREKMSIAFGNEGMGVIGILSVDATVAAGVSTLTFTTDTNMQYYRKGQKLEAWAPAYPVVTRHGHASSATFNQGMPITEVNRAARTVKVTGDMTTAPAAVAGDYIMYQNEGIGLNGAAAGSNLDSGKQITGLQQLYSTGNKWVRLQGLAYATLPELKSPRSTAGSDRNLTPDLMQVMKDDIEIASKEEVDFIWMDHFQHRKLLAGGLADVRHVSQKIKLGYTELDWNGKKIFVDRLAPPGKVFMGSLKTMGRAVLAEMGPMDASPGGERLPGFAVQEWAFGSDQNLFTRNPVAGGWLENLTKS